MPLEPVLQLLPARIAHGRKAPRAHAFSYRALYLMMPLSALKSPPRHALFSVGRFNLFAFRTADHGDGSNDPEAWAREVLRRFGHESADGGIWLVTLPRILGAAFNPVSFWLCHDRNGALRAVIAEVNNTFGERHFYVCGHEDGRAIASGDWLRTDKVFHVSPFLEVEGQYCFRFALEGQGVAIYINYYKADTLALATSMVGAREELTSWRLLKGFASNPLIVIKVIGLIYWQALQLFLKGSTYRTKPKPPDLEYSR